MSQTNQTHIINGYKSAIGYTAYLILQAAIVIGLSWYIGSQPTTEPSSQVAYGVFILLFPFTAVGIFAVLKAGYTQEHNS